ncbi:EAL domain-containing protein [Weissella kandleri]|uniref:EAL domain-containing protein n=1 Tax=Weissella kandleri TaxID=1616 RepID=UPI00387E7931
MNDFYFVAQKIVNLEIDGSSSEYELLLRSHQAPGFPQTQYLKMISDEKNHKDYMEIVLQVLPQILKANLDDIFSFNLDQQELEYEATFEMLEMLAQIVPNVHARLWIEITELPAQHRSKPYANGLNVEAFARLQDMGYQVAFDDFGQGNNSLGNMLLIVQYVKRIKWSLLHVRKLLNQDVLKLNLELLISITKNRHLDLVVEGVENQDIVDCLLQKQVCLQQGYHFEKPHEIAPMPLVIDESKKILS